MCRYRVPEAVAALAGAGAEEPADPAVDPRVPPGTGAHEGVPVDELLSEHGSVR